MREHAAGPALAAILLCKMVTLGLALLFMNFVFLDEPNLAEGATWAAIAAVSAAWLAVGARRMGPVPDAWLRPTLWGSEPRLVSPTSSNRRGGRRIL
jgi:hypothetical protein